MDDLKQASNSLEFSLQASGLATKLSAVLGWSASLLFPYMGQDSGGSVGNWSPEEGWGIWKWVHDSLSSPLLAWPGLAWPLVELVLSSWPLNFVPSMHACSLLTSVSLALEPTLLSFFVLFRWISKYSSHGCMCK